MAKISYCDIMRCLGLTTALQLMESFQKLMKVLQFENTDVDTTVVDKQLQPHYIYIDNRPMSLTRNPVKCLLKILRESSPNAQKLQQSFIYLNFHCDAEKIRYDCNLDPAKSEVVFEKFEIVCQCFRDFVEEIYGISRSRSTSPASPSFFPCIHENSRLPSPPPSSPVLSLGNPFAVVSNGENSENASQRKLRQTRLEEFKSAFAQKESEIANNGMRSGETGRIDSQAESIIRSMMGCMPSTDGIDLTQGIVSGNRPRHLVSPDISGPLDGSLCQSGAQRMHVNTVSDLVLDDPKSRGEAYTRDGIKLLPGTRTVRNPVQKARTPRTPSARHSRKRVPLDQSSLPHTPCTPITPRSISESPRSTITDNLSTTWNPWSLAAVQNRNFKPSGMDIDSRIYRNSTGHGHEDDGDGMFMKATRPDLGLQTKVLRCEILMEEVAAGQFALLSHFPPECDLMEFIMQYSSEFLG
jgi:DNA mismatch repair ATPase MutL